MAKLFKKVQKLVNSTGNRLRKTLVEYNLGNVGKEQAITKGDIFYQTWIGYWEIQYVQALEENVKRDLMETFIKTEKRE